MGLFSKELWDKRLSAWYLYDFANSIPGLALSLYFSQWIVVDQGVGDFWFALPFMAATALLIFVSPIAGIYGDRSGNHHKVFIFASLLAALAAFGVWFFASFAVSLNAVILSLILYGVYQFFIQLALVPYTSFIKHIASNRLYGAVSGIGIAANELGHATGILLGTFVSMGFIAVLGAGRLSPLILPPLIFILLAIPAFTLLRAPAHPTQKATKGVFSPIVKSFKDAKQYAGVRPLLLSFYLFSDALASINLFAAIYLEKVFGIPDSIKAIVFLLVVAGWFVGGFAGGFLSDRFGHRRTLILALCACAVATLLSAAAQSKTVIIVAFPLFGVFVGMVYTSSRAYLASLIPRDESGKYFGLYTFSERFASIIGPALWGLIIWLFRDSAPLNYRFAAFAMAVLVILSIIPLITSRKNLDAKS